MKKTSLIIFSFILLIGALAVLSACSVKLPSMKQTPQAVNEVKKENPATSTPTVSACENKTSICQATTTNNCNTNTGEEWCESTQKCQIKWKVKCPGDKNIKYDGQEFDAETFEIICTSTIVVVRDKNGIHFPPDTQAEVDGTGWTVLNAKTFTNFNCTYFKDDNRIFAAILAGQSFYCKDVAGADPKTFEIIKYDYIYTGSADPTYRPTIHNPYYAKDKNNVYNLGFIISGVDQATFKVLDKAFSEDKNNVYFSPGPFVAGGKIAGADVKTFKILSPTNDEWMQNGKAVSADKNNVYCDGSILAGADAKTFRPISAEERNNLGYNRNSYIYEDKTSFYDMDCNVIK